VPAVHRPPPGEERLEPAVGAPAAEDVSNLVVIVGEALPGEFEHEAAAEIEIPPAGDREIPVGGRVFGQFLPILVAYAEIVGAQKDPTRLPIEIRLVQGAVDVDEFEGVLQVREADGRHRR
jgi:hypothetical protein